MSKSKDNKNFWQRYAPIYWLFIRSAGKAYDNIADKVSAYISKEAKVLELACGTGEFNISFGEEMCKLDGDGLF